MYTSEGVRIRKAFSANMSLAFYLTSSFIKAFTIKPNQTEITLGKASSVLWAHLTACQVKQTVSMRSACWFIHHFDQTLFKTRADDSRLFTAKSFEPKPWQGVSLNFRKSPFRGEECIQREATPTAKLAQTNKDKPFFV